MIITVLTRLIFAAYFLEAGLILIVAPWSGFWEQNGFLAAHPAADAWFASPFVRGAVTGVGVITAIAGFLELAGVFGLRRPADMADSPSQE